MQRIRAIIFDLDNTLIDFMRMKEESCKAAVKAMISSGLKMGEEEAYAQLMNTYFDLGLESDCAFTDFLRGVGQFNHKILAAALNSYLKMKDTLVEPYPDVELVLKKLNKEGIAAVIVTDAPKTKAYQRLLAMGIEAYFRFVVGFEDTRNGKQTGLPLLLALDKLRKEAPDLVNSFLLYIQLEEALFQGEQDYISKVAKTESEICSLVEAGFEYVTDFSGSKIFRKPKL